MNKKNNSDTPLDTSRIVAEHNDHFRSMIHIPHFGTPEIDGRVLVTRGISALSPLAQISILAAVRTFNAFTPDNDPYGEHDFGTVADSEAGRVFWKIDYYDTDYRYGSENPADPTVTRRVLTVMLASEY
ncbi:DUF3768 domain-containing protein [Shinella granuli]|uniref:Uncharacterized protein DUF3768 n=1 Tax=Shinella granuli TaxID=323621 RepID=A0A4R2CYI3_SHIGR|nr:DUF3768 domain-containing protein [Shinella granuli]TCN46341.1 uncharacterized protein DUF3768 [Shinella granuli]